MKNATYQTIPALLAAHEPFTHGSCSAVRTLNGGYRVYSYTTRLAETDGYGTLRYFDNRRYSQTTSRLQAIVSDVFNVRYDARVVYDW